MRFENTTPEQEKKHETTEECTSFETENGIVLSRAVLPRDDGILRA